MKKLLYTLAAISLSPLVMGQTETKNYVKTTTYQAKTQNGTTNAATGQALTDDDKIENITYFDGLGRPQQSIAKQAGGNKQHIVTPVVYDAFGRQAKDYLPYTYSSSNSTALNYMSPLDVLEDLESYYVNKYPEDQITSSAINAYSGKVFEASPLSRVLEQGAPGNDWLADPLSDTDHTIKFGYQINSEDEVRSFKVSHPSNDTEQTALEYEGHYAANELYKTVTRDENWQPDPNPLIVNRDHTTEEFKDKQGRVILKRTYNNTVAHDTYYVYDDYGNLTYVLSPEGSDAILDGSNNVLQPVLDKLCYQYRYDYRNRLIEKKIPGKGWEHIVYNKLDQPILTQDAQMDAQNLWLFTKYDAYGRVAYTGTMSTSSPRATLQASVNGLAHTNTTRVTSPSTIAGTILYYDNQAYPTVNIQQLLTINYYDDYKWDTGSSFEASYLMTLSGLTKSGNVIAKPSASSSNWDAGFKSQATITGDGYIQWTIRHTDKLVMVGLSKTDSAPDNHFNTIDYAIYTGSGTESRVFIYEEGVGQFIPTTYCAVGDVFKVERVGDRILYKKNDVVFHSSGTASTGTLVGDSSFFSPKGSIEDVFIGYSVMGQSFTDNAKSLATGSKVRVLDTNDWITSVSYYDAKGRPIHSTSTNAYLGTTDTTSSLLDFAGKVLKSHSTHSIASGPIPIVTVDKFTYDHTGRLLRQVQSINGGTEQLITKNNFDELGQLAQKQVGGRLAQRSAYANYEPNVSTAHNIITKTGGTNVWTDAGVSTQMSIQGDGYLSFKVTQVWNSFMAGLSYTDANVNFTSINYAIYINAGGKVYIYETGTNKGEKTNHVPGDRFSVERRGTSIYYLKNGEPFYASLVPTTTASMVGDVSILHTGTVIRDLVLVDLESALQDVDYAYNIRGWLKTINDPGSLGNDLFGFRLGYNDPTVSGATALYNGNISETLWKTDNIDNGLKSYRYTYDALNRITKGIDNTVDQRYSLGSANPVSYDKNGNILSLHRKGHTNMAATTFGVMDNLAYLYDGNQLLRVTDNGNTTFGFKDGNTSGDDYVYDVNGNMTVDRNKNIVAIGYNHLNLPTSIQFDNISPDGTISYKYDATGTKMEKRVFVVGSGTTVTQYAGNYIYEYQITIIPGGTTSTTSELKFFNHPEGYIEPDGFGNFDYIYQYKDHLGNIRLSYKLDGTGIDGFNNGTTGSWEAHSSTISNENDRLKVVLSDADVGVFKIVSAAAGETLAISLDVDRGTTDKVSLYEYGAGKLSDLVNGYNQISYTPTVSGDFILLIVKDPISNDVGTQTHFYLDNIGVTVGEEELVIVEENNFYPFGLKHKGYNNVISGTDHKYGFGGKEEQDELGLGWIDITARNYDPALGRWMNLDPLAELMRRHSPYNYAFNNPVYFIDPDGMTPIAGPPKNGNRVNSLTYDEKNKTYTFSETTYKETDFKLTRQESHGNSDSNSSSKDDIQIKTFESSKTTTNSVTVLNSEGDIISASSVSETTTTTKTVVSDSSSGFMKPVTESIDSETTITNGNQMGPLATVSSQSLDATGTLPIWDDSTYSQNLRNKASMSQHDPAGYKLTQAVKDNLTKTNKFNDVITDLSSRGNGGYNSYRWKTKREQDSYINNINGN